MAKTWKIGIGYDVHSLVPGRRLVLGGVDIPFDKGLSGWSDADVLTHAIIDAGYESDIKPWTKNPEEES